MLKNTIATMLLIFSCAAFAQMFDLKICVDRNGNPDPDGKPFEQYFYSYPSAGDTVINIGGRKYLFKCELNSDGIRRNHPDVINWEIEKSMRCEVFKLFQIKMSTVSAMTDSNCTIKFLQIFPDRCESVAPVFYLWQQTAGKQSGANTTYNLRSILAKMGSTGKQYAKILEQNNQPQRFGIPPVSDIIDKTNLDRYTVPAFDRLIAEISQSSSYNSSVEIVDSEQIRILQMLEYKSPPEIVKSMLSANVIKAGTLGRLTIFLEMCPEWPPEAVEFMKKQYLSPGQQQFGPPVRDKIIAVSVKNQEMTRWLKPCMPDFITSKKDSRMNSRTAVAYMLISGESDPVKIVRDHVAWPADFVYEYAYATGRYDDACGLIEKLKPYSSGYSSRESSRMNHDMLYDKSDLSAANRTMLLKQFLPNRELLNCPDTYPDGSINISKKQAIRNFSQQIRMLHPDNLPVLLAMTKTPEYTSSAWMALEAFPVNAMPPDVAVQYLNRCEQELQSVEPKIRSEAIQHLRFFTTDAQRPQAVKLLFNQMLTSDASARSVAADSLTAMGPACLPELMEAIGGNEPYFAVRACELIGGMGLYGQKAAPGLLKLLNVTQDWMLKTMIIKALAQIKGTDAIPDIEKYVSAKQPMLAATAAQALVLLKPIPKEILNDPSDFVQNYNKTAGR